MAIFPASKAEASVPLHPNQVGSSNAYPLARENRNVASRPLKNCLKIITTRLSRCWALFHRGDALIIAVLCTSVVDGLGARHLTRLNEGRHLLQTCTNLSLERSAFQKPLKCLIRTYSLVFYVSRFLAARTLTFCIVSGEAYRTTGTADFTIATVFSWKTRDSIIRFTF